MKTTKLCSGSTCIHTSITHFCSCFSRKQMMSLSTKSIVHQKLNDTKLSALLSFRKDSIVQNQNKCSQGKVKTGRHGIKIPCFRAHTRKSENCGKGIHIYWINPSLEPLISNDMSKFSPCIQNPGSYKV